MIHEAQHQTQPIRDKRALWENSPALRESVRDDLYEWGGAQRGGGPNLGYPTRCAVFTEDTSKTFRYDQDKIQEMNDTFSLWMMIVDRCGDQQAKKILDRELKVIKHYFIGEEPVEAIATKCRCSVPTVYRALGNGMYRFWWLHT